MKLHPTTNTARYRLYIQCIALLAPLRSGQNPGTLHQATATLPGLVYNTHPTLLCQQWSWSLHRVADSSRQREGLVVRCGASLDRWETDEHVFKESICLALARALGHEQVCMQLHRRRFSTTTRNTTSKLINLIRSKHKTANNAVYFTIFKWVNEKRCTTMFNK